MGVSEDTSEDHGHLPAVEDWPQGFGEASWWPFIAAMGASGIYIGASLLILSFGELPLRPVVGGSVFLGSVAVFLIGLYGWTYHAFIKAYWEHESEGTNTLRWGLILFLCTEVATFGALFIYYFQIRLFNWPPADFAEYAGPLISGTITVGSLDIPVISRIALINTAILVASSITMHWAHVQLHKDQRRNFIIWLGVTLLLGVIFLGGQAYEYYEFIVHEGFTLGAFTQAVYTSAFYGLTGLHGLHVTMGAILLATLFVRALYGQYSPERDTSVTTISMYWHFVDAIWIFLVALLYFGAVISTV